MRLFPLIFFFFHAEHFIAKFTCARHEVTQCPIHGTCTIYLHRIQCFSIDYIFIWIVVWQKRDFADAILDFMKNNKERCFLEEFLYMVWRLAAIIVVVLRRRLERRSAEWETVCGVVGGCSVATTSLATSGALAGHEFDRFNSRL